MIVPGAATGNAGEQVSTEIPFDLESAMTRTRESALMQDYLGERYLKSYTSCKRNEFQAFRESGDSEAAWYL